MESEHSEPTIYGITDGKAVGTYLEHKFMEYLRGNYDFTESSSAKGVDFPEIGVDIKVTSIKQPQSSCPFKSARQKIFGLGYALLVFVYEKIDDDIKRTGTLKILHAVFVSAERTADYQTSSGIRKILENNGNEDDVLAFLEDRMLPADNMETQKLVAEIIQKPPDIGYLTISNALQWRLQYGRVIEKAGQVTGVIRIK